MTLNLFFGMKPSGDRWLPGDHHIRDLVRQAVRGKPKVFGLERTFLNLCAGLDRLGVNYRVNDYMHARKHANETACIIGTPYLLNKTAWENPIIFGPAGYSHPTDDPDLPNRLTTKRILVYSAWMKEMCEPYWNGAVAVWPVGIDTDKWKPTNQDMQFDVLVYDKIMWDHERQRGELLSPLLSILKRRRLNTATVRYGYYREEEYWELLHKSKAMLFLCEHETQGIAYQQALSCGVPVLAWEQGMWLDPSYYPKIKASASSVPYFDERCGLKFKDLAEFPTRLEEFLKSLPSFAPRDFILENLTLEACAARYVRECSMGSTRWLPLST